MATCKTHSNWLTKLLDNDDSSIRDQIAMSYEILALNLLVSMGSLWPVLSSGESFLLLVLIETCIWLRELLIGSRLSAVAAKCCGLNRLLSDWSLASACWLSSDRWLMCVVTMGLASCLNSVRLGRGKTCSALQLKLYWFSEIFRALNSNLCAGSAIFAQFLHNFKTSVWVIV